MLPPSVMRHIAWNEERGAVGSDAEARSKQVGSNSNQPIATNTRQRTSSYHHTSQFSHESTSLGLSPIYTISVRCFSCVAPFA